MSYLINSHVDRLRRHLPFDANANDLYEERQDLEDVRRHVETRAEKFVKSLLLDASVRLVLLTGDAGHGKTHLCRTLLEAYGRTAEQALAQFRADKLGRVETSSIDGSAGLPVLRIIPDLSEIEPTSTAGHRLRELLEEPAGVTVVCANEGRLRDAVARSGEPALGILLETLESGLRTGLTSLDPRVHVVNLNFQSVTPESGGFFEKLLEDWAVDGRRWQRCAGCDGAAKCPILANRVQLAGPPEDPKSGTAFRSMLLQLVRTVEQTGYVLTVREALILSAYLITGNLSCADVARGGRRVGHDSLSLLFERRLEEADNRHLPVLKRLRRFDPGMRALRDVDERLARELDAQDVAAGRGLTSPPRNVQEARAFVKEHRARMRGARRRDCASLLGTSQELQVERARRLGLRHYGDFLVAVEAADDDPRRKVVRNRIIDGLHVLQGIRPKSELDLYLTDPAFGQGAASAPIISRRIPRTTVRVVGMERGWDNPVLSHAVDWVPRGVVVFFGADSDDRLGLDLLEFELVARAGGGVVFRETFAPEIRRILRRLAQLTGGTRAERDILVLVGAHPKRLSLDAGDFVVGEP